MDELLPQNDGYYAVCFKNHKNVSTEEVENIFKEYGDVFSIRQSSEPVPWVFIRYKNKEEAQKALDDLQDYKDFDIQVARTFGKKKRDQDGYGKQYSRDREKSDDFSDSSRDNRSTKGAAHRNKGSERFIMDSEEDNSFNVRGSPKKVPYNKKSSNFVERSDRMKEEVEFNPNDEDECARALFPKAEMETSKTHRTSNEKHSRGRDDSESCRRSLDSSPPRLVKKSPGNQSAKSPLEHKKQPGSGPPKLVKGSEYYASVNHANATTRGLALRAAYEEVWANHPLRSEMQLREVIMTNFENVPSRKDIYHFCSPVKPLHVSFGMTLSQSVFCRILVANEGDVEHLCQLSSEDVYVTTLEELLDTIFLDENGE